ncbi:uncharacterized protein BJ212DRAFT_1324063 [Suillus subaureus]|uniref:Uncharacterized protein n=1 Tax=Suillus subaureus TaxID=48587 RepID=A0A9P7EJI8_9AGAM|nr:uncharacterized protein BJ212DRAFT_1324063 [Suillus subaureus]KAG1823416.1 hypothetical protein BJ212DRAFT_1324063 [Suillus subaureus]
MASTSSQTSTSPQHSSTSNSDNNNQIMSNFFTANGSPTLVVAFLVIGLAMVTMGALFGWRRMSRGRLLVQPARPTRVRPGRKPIVLGEKPTLWDMWARREEMTIDSKWENLTPFCATLFCPTEGPPRPALKAVEPQHQNPPRSSSVMTRMSAFRQHFRPMNPPPLPLPESRAHELDDMSERPGSGAPSLTRAKGPSVVMAFTIAMPSPNRKRDNAVASSEASGRAPTPELLYDTELGEYCIGSVEASCSEDR